MSIVTTGEFLGIQFLSNLASVHYFSYFETENHLDRKLSRNHQTNEFCSELDSIFLDYRDEIKRFEGKVIKPEILTQICTVRNYFIDNNIVFVLVIL